jgi:hypothetical protein
MLRSCSSKPTNCESADSAGLGIDCPQVTELDPTDGDTAYGLCDAGIGWPELGTISIRYLESIKGPGGYPIAGDSSFKAKWALSEYLRRAKERGIIAE